MHIRKSKFKSVCLIICILALGMVGCREKSSEVFELQDASVVEEFEKAKVADEVSLDRQIYVDIGGQVYHPGVFCLPEGSRVFHAIEQAGGMTEDADASELNQAEILEDGQKLYIPSKKEVEERKEIKESSLSPGVESDGRININTANVEELMTLSGIGKARAEAICFYREKNGSFSSIEEIKKIEGIKDGIFQKIKDHITV